MQIDTSGNKSLKGFYQIAWDSTSMGLLKECPYKYFLKILCGWQKDRLADALIFGIAFHHAMEVFHYRHAQGLDYNQCQRLALKAALSRFKNKDGSIYTSEKKERNLYSLLRAICWYLDTHFDDGKKQDDNAKTVILPSGEPAAELSFRWVIEGLKSPEGDDLFVCGHLDRIAEHAGLKYVSDYKTTGGALNSRFFEGFSPDNQMSLYDISGSIILSEPIAGVMVDGVKLNVHSTEFQRGFAPRNKESREEFLDDFKFYIKLSFLYADQKHWPMNEKACGNYGGCEFRDVCNKPASLREGYLKSKYSKSIWDPLTPREDESKAQVFEKIPAQIL